MADASGIVVAAPSSGSGKTVATLGLLRALSRGGRQLVSAKVGPDYIDPRYHEAACGRPCVNLDGWAMRHDHVRCLLNAAAQDLDLCVVEGVMGLFDGPVQGFGSTADLAALLKLPVVLVLDVRTQAQSAAALVHGFATFRDDCRLAGVILNRTGSPRHADMIEAALMDRSIPVLGAIPNAQGLDLPSRHLGLVQAGEHPELETFISLAAGLVADHIDLDRFAALAGPLPAALEPAPALPPLAQTIAVARDEAFGFAYTHLLEGWHRQGAEISIFSPLADEAPPVAGAVFLPGGYPELHAGRLAANTTFLDGLKQAATRGALVYGECGGFMVLGDQLTGADGEDHAMAGLLPVHTSFAERKLQLGYRRLEQTGALPWPGALRGHEFHYSVLAHQGACESLFTAADSSGNDLGAIGAKRGSVMGSYAHVIDMEVPA